MNYQDPSFDVVPAPDPKKRLELYVFVSPLCEKSWKLQSVIRKLQIEYGTYFTVRTVLATKLTALNTVGFEKTEQKNSSTHPVLASVAIKAAELQGRRAGSRFFHSLQEHLFLKTKDVASYSILLDIAEEATLDLDEFQQDFHSAQAAKAFQCDMQITREMEVDVVPSIVFFNENIEDEGVKVAGLYTYDIYEAVLKEMLGKVEPKRQDPPPMDELFKKYQTLATREIASIYNIPEQLAERELKKHLLQQKLTCIDHPEGTLWKVK
ncbi:DsbA family protein [Planococcus lenghuensis]|uniref:ClpXP adapter protein SpxH n=1 Tax=Planococcus lenghuensis TaxID=2213202 RepID=A0A1Q2L0H8_9BACL|nr:DsbA family protein [Planococcus lenghuensis]AQQ53906.1 dithiol-disulfide isomerase [Planococcus lenghuensis]